MAHVADRLSFETLADLEHVVTERCRVLNGDQLKPGTNFHWWPEARHPGLISRSPYDRRKRNSARPGQGIFTRIRACCS